jgi:hypothetical protein
MSLLALTMNKLSALVAIVVCFSVLVLVGLKRSAPPSPQAPAPGPFLRLEEGTLFISGQNVTLRMVLEAVGDPGVLRFDPDRGIYVCNASIEVSGSLQLGDPQAPDVRETLEFRTFACGDRSIRITEGGRLSVYNSEIATVLRQIDEKLCSRGYTVVSDGQLVLSNATIAYMSGSFGRPARKNASCRIVDSHFSEADGNAFFAENVDGSALDIRDSRFDSRGDCGFVVSGPGRGALRLVHCRLRGAASDIHHAGKDAEVILLDCDFRKDAISFNQLNGIITVQWTLAAQVVDAQGNPAQGITVHARSDPSCGEIEEDVSAVTDAQGKANLVLTEFVADPFNPRRLDRVNNRTPHQVWAADQAGNVLARTTTEVKSASQSVILRISPSTGQ